MKIYHYIDFAGPLVVKLTHYGTMQNRFLHFFHLSFLWCPEGWYWWWCQPFLIQLKLERENQYFVSSVTKMWPLTFIGKSRKQNPKIGKSPTVFHGNKIQKYFKNPDLGTSPAVIYGNKIQAKILSTWS